MGRGYSSDDNRSMQLNPNNDRYYSSRGIDRDDLDWDYEENDNNETGENMLFEIGNQIINSRNISSIYVKNCDVTFETKKVDNDEYDRYCDSGYESKKKIRTLSIIVDVDAKVIMTNDSNFDIAMYGNESERKVECRYGRSNYKISKYFPDINSNLSLSSKFICIDKLKNCDNDSIEKLKEKIRFEIQSTVNQFVIDYVNQAMKK